MESSGVLGLGEGDRSFLWRLNLFKRCWPPVYADVWGWVTRSAPWSGTRWPRRLSSYPELRFPLILSSFKQKRLFYLRRIVIMCSAISFIHMINILTLETWCQVPKIYRSGQVRLGKKANGHRRSYDSSVYHRLSPVYLLRIWVIFKFLTDLDFRSLIFPI